MLITSPRRRDEHGAVTIIVALMMVALCVAAAMVVDLGLLRVDRQQAKSAQDAAAMAGADSLAPNPNDPTFHPFLGVCRALQYLKVNDPAYATYSSSGWFDGTGTTQSSDGCTDAMAALVCTPNSPGTFARFVGTTADGRSTVYIQSGYKNPDGNTATPVDKPTAGNITEVTGGEFAEDALPAYAGDDGDPAYGGCDQVVVIITETRNTSLGAPAASTMGTRTRSVARVRVDPPKSPFALLMLERDNCQVLANTSNGQIDVTGYKANPALIHVDSDGKSNGGDNCNSKPIILGAKSGGVVAHEAPDTKEPGQISTVGSVEQSDGVPNVYAGPLPGTSPSVRGIVTRVVLDKIYLQGVTDAKNSARPFLLASAAPSGFTAKGCPNNDTWTEPKLFINCPSVNKSINMPNATDVIFTGQVGGDVVSMPKATRVYIVGGTTPAGVSVGTTFEMNNLTAGASCPTTWNSTRQRAQLFIWKGDLAANGGVFRACNTTIFLMGSDIDACLPSLGPSYVARYVQDGKVCPGPGPGAGLLSLGGNTTVDWTAPDLVDDEVMATPAEHTLLEDLALWTETSGTHTLGGGGSMHLMGVFAAPNASPMKLNGGPTQNVKNSQYVARSLWTTGSGTLQMQPLPSLPIAPPTLTVFLAR